MSATPTAPITEAHVNLAAAVCDTYDDENFDRASQLIADSEARACDQLRAEVKRLKADGAASAFIDMSCRASRAEAELAVERARLDWLEKRGPWESWNGIRETGITLRENIRAAIDAAMKESAK
jgi:aminoglycoside phosphotransferase